MRKVCPFIGIYARSKKQIPRPWVSLPDLRQLPPFQSTSELMKAIQGTLALDIRSPVQKDRHPNPGTFSDAAFFTGDLWFHELHITYSLLPRGNLASVRVEDVQKEKRQSCRGSFGV